MKFGITLRYDAGADRVIEDAKRADRQGFDSVWLSDHLIMPSQFGEPRADAPLDNFTLMTAIGAVTSNVRLAWSMLNPSFRNPAVLAKMLATLDLITHGRVIAALGAGNNKEEYDAYHLPPYLDDHADRTQQGREVVQLMKELWTHPAPERVTFTGRFVGVTNLPFNPAPFQKPHPPIWVGGDSDSTIETVKQHADGWVMLRSGPNEVAAAMLAPDWPSRPITLVKGMRIIVAETADAAMKAAKEEFISAGSQGNLDDFLATSIVGDADECLERLEAVESTGINYIRLNFRDEASQERVARLLVPRLGEIRQKQGV